MAHNFQCTLKAAQSLVDDNKCVQDEPHKGLYWGRTFEKTSLRKVTQRIKIVQKGSERIAGDTTVDRTEGRQLCWKFGGTYSVSLSCSCRYSSIAKWCEFPSIYLHHLSCHPYHLACNLLSKVVLAAVLRTQWNMVMYIAGDCPMNGPSFTAVRVMKSDH